MNIEQWLEKTFPRLKSKKYKISSPEDPTYNCIAWSLGDNQRWWEPDPMGDYYWPPEISRSYSLDSYKAIYLKRGFTIDSDHDIEHDLSKIALFAKNDLPTHASKKTSSRNWSSKLGSSIDIEHELEGLIGEAYGIVKIIFKKKN
ncbi:hypothetical protein KA005_81860 [bacterium]|nr:hypothetical protein [bacterium]